MYNFPMWFKNASPTPRRICSLYLFILKNCWFIMCFVVVVQSINYVRLFVTPWTAAHQASLSSTVSRSLFRLMSTVLMMPSNHPILCHPLLLLPSIFSSIKVFSNESVLCIWWSKHWSFSFSISPSNECSGLICLFFLLLLLLSHFSHVRFCATLWTAAHQAALSLGFSRQECWSGLPFPSPVQACVLSCCSCVWLCDPRDSSPLESSVHGIL